MNPIDKILKKHLRIQIEEDFFANWKGEKVYLLKVLDDWNDEVIVTEGKTIKAAAKAALERL